MNDFADLSRLIQPESIQLDLLQTLYNFFICVFMAFIVRFFYISRSFSLTGKLHIGSIIPVLSAVVFLVIVIVKSSLALSLGLVGALSIVRFRTPIKEPEELVYLFLAIALGLGYAAGHTLVTTVLVSLTLIMIYFWLSNRHMVNTSEYNLIINWKNKETTFEDLSKQISDSVQSLKLVRMERGLENNMAVLLVTPHKEFNIDRIVSALHEIESTINVSFYEAKTNW